MILKSSVRIKRMPQTVFALAPEQCTTLTQTGKKIPPGIILK